MEFAEIGLTSTDVMDEVLDHKKLNELIETQRNKNPALKDQSLEDIADGCGISETTLKSMQKGRNKNPRVGTLARLLNYIGGGSIDELVHLQFAGVFKADNASHGLPIIRALEARITAKDERITEYKEEVVALEAENQRVRKLYLKAREDLSSATEKCSQIEEYRKRVVRLRTALIVFVALALIFSGILLYLTWDVSNPNSGKIGEVIWR